MNLQNLFGCHEILQSRGLLNRNSVAFPICVDCRYLEHERWGDVTNRQNTPSKVRKRAYERFPRAIRATFHALYLVAPGEMHQSLLLPGRLRKLKKILHHRRNMEEHCIQVCEWCLRCTPMDLFPSVRSIFSIFPVDTPAVQDPDSVSRGASNMMPVRVHLEQNADSNVPGDECGRKVDRPEEVERPTSPKGTSASSR